MIKFLRDLSKYFMKEKTVEEKLNIIKSKSPKMKLDKQHAQQKGLDLDPEVYGYINPFLKISFEYEGKEITSMPLCFMAHAYLKDYGFDPDSKISSLKLTLTFAPGNQVKLPFYLQKKVNIHDTMTPEAARKAGFVL